MKRTARYFKALADETRLRILALLLTTDELCVCDIMAALQLPQSTASRHLAYLKNAGWLDDRRQGVWMYYSIASDENQFQSGLAQLLKEHLSSLATARPDLERLEEFRKSKSCV